MKKLMTMIAAAAMSFGLFADGVISNSTAFAKLPDGPLDIMRNDEGGQEGTVYWSYSPNPIGEGEATIASHELVLKTGSKVLTRNFQGLPYAQGGDFPKTTIPAGLENGLFLDTQVKFGAPCDEIATDSDLGDAKFAAFFVDETEIDGWPNDFVKGTNLWVIGSDGTSPAAFRMTVLDGMGNDLPISQSWLDAAKRVAVKAYASATTDGLPGFIIYIGENFAKVNGKLSIANNAVTPAAFVKIKDGDKYLGDTVTVTRRYDNNQLVLSMAEVQDGKLQGAAFRGTGTVDSIYVGEVAPANIDFTEIQTMDVELHDVTITVTGGTLKDGKIEGKDGNQITVVAESEDPTAKECFKFVFTGDEPGKQEPAHTYTFNFQEGAKLTVSAIPAAAKVNGVAYAMFEDALTAAQTAAATADTTIVLNRAVTVASETGVTLNATAYELTLDLAGQKLSFAVLADDFSDAQCIANAATLKITDSSIGKTGKIENVVADGNPAALIANTGSVTIDAGTFDGALFDTGKTSTYTISGGSFLKTLNTGKDDKFKYEVVEGKAANDDGNYWTVGDPIVTKGTVIFICEKTQLNTTNSWDIGTLIDFPTVEGDTTIAKGWFKEATFVNPADTTVQAGENTYYANVVDAVAKIGDDKYETADKAFKAAEENGGKVEIIAACNFTGSYVFTNANVEISVAANVTLTRSGTSTYPFKVYNKKTLTFSGEGTILKGSDCGNSTLISVGKNDNFAIDSDECGYVVVNGGNLIDEGGSNACSIDCGTFVMNGGYIKSGSASGHAVRVSSKIKDGSAAIVTLNAGKLEAANSAIGVKIAADSEIVIDPVVGSDNTAIIKNVASNDITDVKFAGTITMSLTAGEGLLFSNNKSEFAPRGYGYVASETVTDWFKLGLATYTITAESGTVAGEASKAYSMNKEAAQDFALVAAAPETGKKFKEWTLTATSVQGENVTLADATAAETTLTVGAGAIGNYTVTATYETSGPVIDPTHDTAEIKVEGTKATITLKGTSTEAYVIGGMDLTEVDVPVNLKAIRGVNAEAVKVKVGDYDITAAFTIAANASTGCVDVNLSEDPTATVTIGTETIKVTPMIGENVEASEVKIAEGAIAVQAIPGLTYELIRSTKLGDESTAEQADAVKAETTKVELTDKIAGEKPAAAFYQIKVEAK